MIRDPSDGSVREKPMPPAEPGIAPGVPIVEDIKAAILAGKVNPERLSPEWVYQRAWNDALDFAVMQASRVEKQSA